MKTTRRNFMQAAGAFLAALGLGVKAKAREVVTGVGRGSPLLMLDGFGATFEILDGDEWKEIGVDVAVPSIPNLTKFDLGGGIIVEGIGIDIPLEDNARITLITATDGEFYSIERR